MKRRLILPLMFALIPFGEIEPLLEVRNPWRGSDGNDSVALVSRAERLSPGEGEPGCQDWIRGLAGLHGEAVPYDQAFQGWEPWEAEESQMIVDCLSSPCDIKMDSQEVAKLAASSPSARKIVFLELVTQRVEEFRKAATRRPTESGSTFDDPWKEFARRGYETSLARPTHPTFLLRKLEIAPRDLKPIRQAIDRRIVTSAKEGVVWVRDIYSNHHVDSWGEWVKVECGASDSSVFQVLQALLIESDQLKKGDLFSVLGRSKIRSGMKEQGARFLDRQFVRLSLLAREAKLQPAATTLLPQPMPTPAKRKQLPAPPLRRKSREK